MIPLTLRFLAQKRNLLIPLELSRVMHQGINVEENALITERGIEWLYPPQEKVLLIR